MITEIRQSRTRLLEHNERRSRRRHHTLDNATLDKFNFICIPLRSNEKRSEVSSSQSNLTVITSKDYSISKPVDVSSPSRRVRFKFDENDKNRSHFQQHIHSSDDVRLPKKHKIHRVEFQIPIPTAVNPWLNVARSSTPAKTRSITSQKIDINHNTNNLMYPPSMTSFIDSLPPTVDNSDKTRTQWYKEMYCQIHKSSAAKKDTILVKVPHTPSRYREYYQQRDEPPNPYKPTYTFPDKFDGDLEHMEDYIRKTASQNIDETVSSSAPPVRIPIRNFNDSQMIPKRSSEKVIRFSDQLTSVITTPERVKSSNETSSSPKTIQSRSNPDRSIRTSSSPPTTTSDDEQKSIYKHVLHGGDIPSAGFQRHLINNREKPTEHVYSESQFQSRSNNSESIYKALALHNFYGQTNRELSFKKGEIIFVKRRINDDWLEGECQGTIGIFPLNYVELFPNETDEYENDNEKDQQIEGEAIVKHDFIPQRTFELQLRKGEKVILLRRLDNNWYEGRLDHLEGVFPADYVDILREPKGHPVKNERTPNPAKMPKGVLKTSTGFKQTAVEKVNLVPEFTLPMQKCQVLYDYIPHNVDELEIHAGDIINILEMCDDGWYCGVMEKSSHGTNMKFGTFPGNYVKILPV